jgi:hypothetical protein
MLVCHYRISFLCRDGGFSFSVPLEVFDLEES